MEIILVCLGVGYLSATVYFFLSWLDLNDSNFTLSPPDDLLDLINVLIAALCWPVVAPLADVHFFE